MTINFRYPLHNQILRILRSLDSPFLLSCETYFGGGTMLVMNYDEYRLSRDIDFLCPYGPAFSRLRNAIYEQGYNALFASSRDSAIQLPQEIRADRDGIRFPIQIDDRLLKFEIVAEGRIAFNPPIYPEWSPVGCLDIVDQITEKLMANGDRWADPSTDSRDLLDLAWLKKSTDFPNAAIEKAEQVYRCLDPLKRALINFQAKPEYRQRCYQRLQILSPPSLVDGLDRLAHQFDMPITDRTYSEQHRDTEDKQS